METTLRTVAKALSWQTLGVFVMTALSYPQVGSLVGALGIALSASASGFILYFVHEKIWQRLRWGLVPSALTGTR